MHTDKTGTVSNFLIRQQKSLRRHQLVSFHIRRRSIGAVAGRTMSVIPQTLPRERSMKHIASMFATLTFTAITFMTPQASAQVLITGEAGRAFFKFAVPPVWNGDLVIWNDGLRLAPNVPYTVEPANPLAGLGPLAQI